MFPSKPPLTVEQILLWADEHRARTGRFPHAASGVVHACPEETWSAVNQALEVGTRGLPGGDSLARLLQRERGHRHYHQRALTRDQILDWARAHYLRTGTWPTWHTGAVADAPGETWFAVNTALSQGFRGLPGGTTLARLLSRARPPLSHQVIIRWADEHKARTGKYPHIGSGEVHIAPGESWQNVNQALRLGLRGLPGGDSLAHLLARERGHRHYHRQPALTEQQIVTWATAHRERTGSWPDENSGEVLDAPEEAWSAINAALREGLRGLPGGDSLARVLARHGVRTRAAIPPLTEEVILAWARAYRDLTGERPKVRGPGLVLPVGETWLKIDKALSQGCRGLPGGSSLKTVLAGRLQGQRDAG